MQKTFMTALIVAVVIGLISVGIRVGYAAGIWQLPPWIAVLF